MYDVIGLCNIFANLKSLCFLIIDRRCKAKLFSKSCKGKAVNFRVKILNISGVSMSNGMVISSAVSWDSGRLDITDQLHNLKRVDYFSYNEVSDQFNLTLLVEIYTFLMWRSVVAILVLQLLYCVSIQNSYSFNGG